MQLNLFEDPSDPLWIEYRSLEARQENLRRGLFQRYEALLKTVEQLQEQVKLLSPNDSHQLGLF